MLKLFFHKIHNFHDFQKNIILDQENNLSSKHDKTLEKHCKRLVNTRGRSGTHFPQWKHEFRAKFPWNLQNIIFCVWLGMLFSHSPNSDMWWLLEPKFFSLSSHKKMCEPPPVDTRGTTMKLTKGSVNTARQNDENSDFSLKKFNLVFLKMLYLCWNWLEWRKSWWNCSKWCN